MNLFLHRLWECVAWLIAIVIVGLFGLGVGYLLTSFGWLSVACEVALWILLAFITLWYVWTFIRWLFIEPFRRSKR